MKKIFTKSTLPLFAALCMYSCTDYDYGFNEKDIKYEEHFKEVFGNIDPNQDWSMATQTRVTVNVRGTTPESVVEIYTDQPVYATSKLLKTGKYDDVNFKLFDIVEGTKQVYAIVKESNTTLVSGYYDITEDGYVSINESPVAKASTRALTRATNGVTKGDVVEDFIKITTPAVTHTEKQQVTTPKQYSASAGDNRNLAHKDFGPFGTLDELGNAIYAECDKMNISQHHECTDGSWKTEELHGDCLRKIIGTYVNGHWTSVYCAIETGGTTEDKDVVVIDVPEQSVAINLTYLNGVTKTAAAPWSIELGAQLFGPGTFFQEQVCYYGGSAGGVHPAKTKPQLDGYNLENVEAGFSITTKGGEISLPFIYGATQISDQFGYVYYKDGEDPLTKPHYVLMSDGRPSTNIYWNAWGQSANAVGSMALANWNITTPSPLNYSCADGTNVYGSVYKLSYFGKNHDQAATYDFPSGYNVVFFICPRQIKDGVWGDYNKNDFNYSLPELNKRILHYNWNGTTGKAEGTEDISAGARKATAWKTNGMTFLGFEDGGRDEDLNDIVFWVEGAYDPVQTLAEVEVEITNTKEYQSWIFACEDLGGDDDYDFNDVVWEVVKEFEVTKEDGEVTKKTYKGAKVRMLAAGGTLPFTLKYDDTVICTKKQAFGSETTMYNTGQTRVAVKEYALNGIAESASINDIKSHFILYVDQSSNETSQSKSSNAQGEILTAVQTSAPGHSPQIIIVPSDWEWPTERTSIIKAYPRFAEWVSDANALWNNDKVGGTTMKVTQ